MRDIATTVLLVAGVALAVLAGLGVVLMRDALDRLHYVGLLGPAACCVAAAVFVRDSFSVIGNKALLIGAFALVVSPVLTHFTARVVHGLDGAGDR
jgi:multisubunit Na+/H+ antiporter MnhG subunit